ncbi:hypothetical protein PIB19_16620 [Sphingomonas sp. 7/4-4]|uniref:hypothetical protein n=1 Tax=Sphingomonas sp. 7/4-4 TaxID=3018446 RepID=UPI0022F38479|nr:hypothetical protein [Sphingomonas sp. 7/4-4]WBY07049.1 hypothetical protein PIB19_16620 [Sphingomonas sp. 7/4-4]
MRKLLVASLLAIAAVVATEACAMQRSEASMNFDKENVRPFLTELERRLHLGIEIDALAQFLLDTPIDEEHAVTIPIRYRGKPMALLVRAYMDDVDAPDLYFETDSKTLRNAIDAEMARFAKARGL